MNATPVKVLCIDDNRLMAQAMQRRLALETNLEWVGWVEHSDDAERVAGQCTPDVIMLDIDMPGRDSFEVLRELAGVSPALKVIMFSGHVRADYIDRAVDGGAWGYLSKNESMDDVMAAILRVASGEFVLSPEVSAEYRRGP